MNEAAERILQCSAICFTKTLTSDLQRVSQQLSIPLSEQRERSFRYDISISEADLAHARDVLDEEFKLIAKVKTRLDLVTL